MSKPTNGMGVDKDGGPVVDPSANVRELVDAEMRRVDNEMRLRSEYEDKLRLAEARLRDAIREVDVANVATASERADRAAGVLAAQLTAFNEASRALVASTAQAVATQITNMDARLTAKIESLVTSRDQGTGKSGGMHTGWGYLVGAAFLALAIYGAFRPH